MYDEKDLKTILSRAIQIQKQNEVSGSLSGSIEKLSLSEIEMIARESGLSPEYVREAAIELEGIPIEKPLFLDTGKNHELELLGHAKGIIDQRTWAELRDVIEKDFNSTGVVRRYSEGIQWEVRPSGFFKIFKSLNTQKVELQSSGFRTIIRIKKSLKMVRRILYPAYALLAGALIVFGILLFTGQTSILVAIAGLLISSKLFFKWAEWIREKSGTNLQDTMAKLQTIINRKHTANEQDRRSRGIIDIDPEISGTHETDEEVKHSKRDRTH